MLSFPCPICPSRFPTVEYRTRHQNKKNHYFECNQCERQFGTFEAYEQHCEDVHSHQCVYPNCSKVFRSRESLAQHQRDTVHLVCPVCSVVFFSSHRNYSRHMSRHRQCPNCNEYFSTRTWKLRRGHCYKSCGDCCETFEFSFDWGDHLVGGTCGANQVDEYACVICDKIFLSHAGLLNHNCWSATHTAAAETDLKDAQIACPGGCGRWFADTPTRAAVWQHLDSGACTSGIGRQVLSTLVAQTDTNQLIVDRALAPKNILEADLDALMAEAAAGSRGPKILTPSGDTSAFSSTPGPWTPASTAGGVAIDPDELTASLNGLSLTAFTPPPLSAGGSRVTLRCPLCPSRAPFPNEVALIMHQNSAAHAPRIFRCPVLVGKHDTAHEEKRFSTVSGTLQHWGAKGCPGAVAGNRGNAMVMLRAKKVAQEFQDVIWERVRELADRARSQRAFLEG